MSKSLAHVAILASFVAFAAHIDAADNPTSAPAVKNHISDAERDRLMEQAMENARKELEEKKTQSEAREKVEAEQKELREKKAAEEAAAKKRAEEKQAEQAAAEKKAEEVRLAKQLAEAEKKASEAEKSNDVKNLDEDTSRQAASSKKSDESDSDKSSPDESRKVASSKDSDESDSDRSGGDPERKPDDAPQRKTRIETVSTRLPGEGLSVKTSMPVGDSAREAEQRAARRGSDSGETRRASSSSGSQSYSGHVVGLLHGANGGTKILVQTDDMRMVQASVAKDDVPAPGSVVSIRGRAIGGTSMSPVVDAESVSIKSGQKLEQAPGVAPSVAAAPAPLMPIDPLMPPPLPIIGPPMPMGPGMMPPGPMIGAPPPF